MLSSEGLNRNDCNLVALHCNLDEIFVLFPLENKNPVGHFYIYDITCHQGRKNRRQSPLNSKLTNNNQRCKISFLQNSWCYITAYRNRSKLTLKLSVGNKERLSKIPSDVESIKVEIASDGYSQKNNATE